MLPYTDSKDKWERLVMCFRECSRKERERGRYKTPAEQNVQYLQSQSGPQPRSAPDLSVVSRKLLFYAELVCLHCH